MFHVTLESLRPNEVGHTCRLKDCTGLAIGAHLLYAPARPHDASRALRLLLCAECYGTLSETASQERTRAMRDYPIA